MSLNEGLLSSLLVVKHDVSEVLVVLLVNLDRDNSSVFLELSSNLVLSDV